MAEDEQDMDYDEDYMDNIDNENMDMEDDNNLIGGKYEFLTIDEMDKERQKKIVESLKQKQVKKNLINISKSIKSVKIFVLCAKQKLNLVIVFV